MGQTVLKSINHLCYVMIYFKTLLPTFNPKIFFNAALCRANIANAKKSVSVITFLRHSKIKTERGLSQTKRTDVQPTSPVWGGAPLYRHVRFHVRRGPVGVRNLFMQFGIVDLSRRVLRHTTIALQHNICGSCRPIRAAIRAARKDRVASKQRKVASDPGQRRRVGHGPGTCITVTRTANYCTEPHRPAGRCDSLAVAGVTTVRQDTRDRAGSRVDRARM